MIADLNLQLDEDEDDVILGEDPDGIVLRLFKEGDRVICNLFVDLPKNDYQWLLKELQPTRLGEAVFYSERFRMAAKRKERTEEEVGEPSEEPDIMDTLVNMPKRKRKPYVITQPATPFSGIVAEVEGDGTVLVTNGTISIYMSPQYLCKLM